MNINTRGKQYLQLFTIDSRLILIYFILVICSITFPLSAAVYKWVDENGKTHYSDKPLDEKSETVHIKNTPAPDPAHNERIEKRDRLLKVLDEERLDTKQQRARQAEEKRMREKNCADARIRVQQMKSAIYLYEDTNDPNNPKIYSEEDRIRATQEAEGKVKLWCK